jgi:DNA-binding MarR family transcriptional regulator
VTRQATTLPEVQLAAWVAFLRAHAGLTRELNADLVSGHGLTINDYEVLLHLSRAPGRMLRRVDLAERVVLTASGMTRLLEGLEGARYVERADCSTDRRVVYARLTDTGLAKLREAARTHVAGIRSLFTERYSDEELELLAGLLARLPGAGEAVECDATKDD